MLFYGSKAYPKENYYSEYVTLHGGQSNAFTSDDMTTYHFDILGDHFEHALDVFSHFFIDPIFNEEMVQREINAVDSEFYASYLKDSNKRYQVLLSLMDKEYPVTKFSCGNKKTLCVPDLYKRMMQFYTKYYTSDRMYLVILCKDSLEILENMVVCKFSKINNKKSSDTVENKNIFDNILPFDNFLKTNDNVPFVKIEPQIDKHYFSLIWQLPRTIHKYKYNISNFWGNIIEMKEKIVYFPSSKINYM